MVGASVIGIDSVNRVVWPEMVEVDSGPSVVGIADDVVVDNCTGVVVGCEGTCVVDTVASLLDSEFVVGSSSIVGQVVPAGCSVAANVDDVVDVTSLVVSTVEEPSGAVGSIDVDQIVEGAVTEGDVTKVDAGGIAVTVVCISESVVVKVGIDSVKGVVWTEIVEEEEVDSETRVVGPSVAGMFENVVEKVSAV